MSAENACRHFYRTLRLGAAELSDGGGPFFFDITTALEFDFLIKRYQCDAIIETGCNAGDTTDYLARASPHLAIITCDVVDKYVELVKRRAGHMPHSHVEKIDSPDLIEKLRTQFRCPLYYLDAHWYEAWLLERELGLIEHGVVCVDDFNIGNPRSATTATTPSNAAPACWPDSPTRSRTTTPKTPKRSTYCPACSPVAVAARRTSRLASHTNTCSTTTSATKPRAPDPASGFCGRGFSPDNIPLQPDSIPTRIVADTHGQPGAHRIADDVSRRGME